MPGTGDANAGRPLIETSLLFDIFVADLTGDGAPDVYVCADRGAAHGGNTLLVNDGAGALVDATPLGSDLTFDCMSVSVADVNGDAALDLFVTGLDRTVLLLGADDGYVDVAAAWGVPAPRLEDMGWGTAIADLDNDGLPDLLVARSAFSSDEQGETRPDVLRQRPDGGVSEADAWGAAPPTATRTVAAVDLNADGVLDTVWTPVEGPPRVRLSTGCTAGAWIEVDAPAGSLVRVEAGGRTWLAPATLQPGAGTVQPAIVHIGLGDVDTIDHVEVRPLWGDPARLVGPVEPRQRLRWRPEAG